MKLFVSCESRFVVDEFGDVTVNRLVNSVTRGPRNRMNSIRKYSTSKIETNVRLVPKNVFH